MGGSKWGHLIRSIDVNKHDGTFPKTESLKIQHLHLLKVGMVINQLSFLYHTINKNILEGQYTYINKNILDGQKDLASSSLMDSLLFSAVRTIPHDIQLGFLGLHLTSVKVKEPLL